MVVDQSLFARWRSFPMLIAVILMGLGIVVSPLVSVYGWFVATASAILWIFAAAFWPEKKFVTLRPLSRAIGIAVLWFVFGGFRMGVEIFLPHNEVSQFIPETKDAHPTLLLGTVNDFPSPYRSGIKFTVEANYLERDGRQTPTSGKVLVYLRIEPGMGHPKLKWGDHVQVAGRMEAPRPKRNPADFDFANYLKYKGIRTVLYVREAQTLSVSSASTSWLHRSVNFLRDNIHHTITHFAPNEETAAMQRALLIGDRTGLPEQLKQAFNNTGLTHLLAVSGLHVLLIGMVLFNLLRPLLGRIPGLSWTSIEVIRSLATFIVLMFFLWITGGSPSVVRAVVMAAVFLTGTLLQRETSGLNSLGVAMFVLLLLQPENLYDIGFQLSCAAVAGIVLFQLAITEWAKRFSLQNSWLNGLVQSLGVSLAATATTAPILLFHFGQVSLAGLWLNLLAIPLSNLAILSVLLMVAFHPVSFFIAKGFATTANMFTDLFTSFVSVSDRLFGGLQIQYFLTDFLFVISFVLILLMLVQWSFPRIRYRAAIVSSFFALLGVAIPRISSGINPQLTITFFDVGQGDAALITFPNGRNLLIDAGDRNEFYDAGSNTILPHLRRFNQKRIDAVLISHPHQDHMGGLFTLLQEVEIGHVFTNQQPCRSEICQKVDSLASVRQVPISGVQKGMALKMDNTVQVEVLSPAFKPLAHQDVNSHSVVLRIQYGRHQFLFMGDGTAFTEQELLRSSGVELAADVVKVGHHGSATSSTPEFIKQVVRRKTKAVVSVAERNVYGLPNEGVLGRWRYFGADVLETRSEGAIVFTSDSQSLSCVHWR